MRKFFIKGNQIKNNQIEIIGADVNHIKNVLRLSEKEKIKICDSENQVNYICEISEITKENVKCEILEKAENEAEGNVELHIYQGLPKADKLELIIQKGTELGVTEFIPVALKRSIVKIDGKDEQKKNERWQKIAEVAAKQSGRDCIPKIEHVKTLQDVCSKIAEYDLVLIAYELEEKKYIKNELKALEQKENYKIAVVIGPEGGLEEIEVKKLEQSGGKVITLGKRILRTETVALQVASIIMYELENAKCNNKNN